MTNELKNDPLTHSCNISQRAHSIQKEKEKKRKWKRGSDSSTIPSCGFVSPFVERCVDGGADASLDACRAFQPMLCRYVT